MVVFFHSLNTMGDATDLKTHFVEDRIQILQRRRQEELQRLRKSIEDEHAQKLKGRGFFSAMSRRCWNLPYACDDG